MDGIENIGPRQARRRRVLGVAALVVAAAGYAALLATGAPRPVRLALLAPLFFGFLGVFQASARVCVANAAAGTCDMDAGPAPVEDPARTALRKSALGVLAKAGAAATALTALAYFVPL
jgi:hypothetical protein